MRLIVVEMTSDLFNVPRPDAAVFGRKASVVSAYGIPGAALAMKVASQYPGSNMNIGAGIVDYPVTRNAKAPFQLAEPAIIDLHETVIR